MHSFFSFDILIVLIILSFIGSVKNSSSTHTNESDFDFLLYSQRWSITDCAIWIDKNNTNVCNMPKHRNSFLVHGLWPTKNFTSGPNNCKTNMTFNKEDLNPLLEDLNERWTNIEAGTDSYSFWKHEWQKHGACASVLPQFRSVVDYFGISLNLNLEYDLARDLSDGGIVPREEVYEVDDFLNALSEKYGRIPQVCCTVDSGNRTLLSEIRLCFDKNLSLIDCPPVGVDPRDCRGRTTVFYLNKE